MPSLKSSLSRPVTSQTKFYGVIGQPIGHSVSPAFQNAAFAAAAIDAIYVALEVSPAQLALAIRGAHALGFAGLNVTIPHKQAALAHCEPDSLAQQVGAVNTLIMQPSRIIGTNTDVFGFSQWFRGITSKTGAQPRRVLSLGGGGAARAVLVALHNDGVEQLRVATRRPMASSDFPVAVQSIGWSEIDRHLPDTDLLIDATGQSLSNQKLALSLDKLPPDAWVFDLVAKKTTPLVEQAHSLQLEAFTGTEMLLFQGVTAWEKWTGTQAPVEVMRQALLGALT